MDTLVLVKNGKPYNVVLADYSVVSSSDLPFMVGKSVAAVWRWARQNATKVYMAPFLPPHIEANYVLPHAVCQSHSTE